ncbi:NUDIX hydrolase [Donghicola tyrosinivorans]|uniref:8-oxo-dGTP pyrophosphatase MutT (NUDIX family) n=1 Tax=Donghicola tyrosinivorans TaxID=1652492 RepID=A0A2T0WBQ2_9RHOB|nr:NUDIX hydrolase [Donghicola tyrosinivorans]PRY84056.1 8-oxo-dGTP pyrophosphatase MutT (NUDIX family) [Donghicola tyrosinivorans]
MKPSFNEFVQNYIRPLVQRPEALQTAALCYRYTKTGAKQVLLITSRGTGRWVIPKGWTMRGMDAAGAALVEAWEEAGVRPAATPIAPIGHFLYRKIKSSGLPVRVKVLVYPVEVATLKDEFPEANQRTRRWVSPDEAASMVAEPGLQSIFRQM